MARSIAGAPGSSARAARSSRARLAEAACPEVREAELVANLDRARLLLRGLAQRRDRRRRRARDVGLDRRTARPRAGRAGGPSADRRRQTRSPRAHASTGGPRARAARRRTGPRRSQPRRPRRLSAPAQRPRCRPRPPPCRAGGRTAVRPQGPSSSSRRRHARASTRPSRRPRSPQDRRATQAAEADGEQRHQPGGEQEEPDDAELAQRIELDRVRPDRRLAAAALDEVRGPEAAVADPGQRVVAELVERDPPEVVAVRAEADEVVAAGLVVGRVLERAPAVVRRNRPGWSTEAKKATGAAMTARHHDGKDEHAGGAPHPGRKLEPPVEQRVDGAGDRGRRGQPRAA